jgi:hypothetical protein
MQLKRNGIILWFNLIINNAVIPPLVYEQLQHAALE